MGTMERFRLTDRRAVVTGASRGIGRAIAVALAEAGAEVALVGRDLRSLATVAGEAADIGGRAVAFTADLSNPAAVEGIVPAAEAKLGPIDLLVHAAGVTARVPSTAATLADFQRIMQVNAAAGMQLAQAIARGLIQRKAPGSMVFICSLMSDRARPTVLHYTMSKTALVGLVRTLAVEWAGASIRVNGISPGYIETELTRPLHDDPGFNQWVTGRTPIGRWGQPSDIAPAAVYLASEAANFVTGQVLYVDGGWTAAL
ncbi:MAG: SDR family oxidoreductase [Phycisphaerae bacterium]|nr:SDR family oxidoreductase [Phycisphaerae bacterium]